MTVPFDEALTAAMAVAATSPSSHNCQPWAVARLVSERARAWAANHHRAGPGEEFLVLALDRTRVIGALPAHRTEMQLSCGLYGRLLRRALAAQGWAAQEIAVPAAVQLRGLGLPAQWAPQRLIRLRHTGEHPESLTRLRTTALRRQTNRGPYGDRPVDRATLDELLPAEPAAPPITVRYLRSEHERTEFADFVARHGGRDFAHRQAWRETHSYIRRDEAEAAARGDGFTMANLFGPMSPGQQLIRRLLLAPATMAALNPVGFPRLLAGQLAAVVRRSPAIAAMSLPHAHTSSADLFTAGEWLCDYWLRATDAGLAMHPVSIVVQHDDLRARLQSRFELPGRMFFLARLGYPVTTFQRSPRRDPATACATL